MIMKKIPTIKINKMMIDTIKMIKKEVIWKEMKTIPKALEKSTMKLLLLKEKTMSHTPHGPCK